MDGFGRTYVTCVGRLCSSAISWTRRIFGDTPSSMSEVPRILIVDDHVIVRRGLINLLQNQFNIVTIGEASSCEQLMARLAEEEPDLLVLDLQLSDGNSMELLQDLREDHPEMKVLVYSMRSPHIYAKKVLSMGAAGFLSKESEIEDVAAAIHTILGGGTIEPEPEDDMDRDETDNPFSRLSAREMLVMEGILKGQSMVDIATRLNLHKATVGTYKTRLFEKLGVSNLLELQRLADFYRPN